MATITITEVSDGTLIGSGAFDKLMVAGKAHLLEEYTRGRITGKDYSTVYLGMMQSVLAQAMQFVLGQQAADKQADLYAQKTITEIAQTVDATGGTTAKQQALIAAQTDGFARDAEQKIAKIFSDIYAIHVSALGSGASTPAALQDPDISAVMLKAAQGIGVTITA